MYFNLSKKLKFTKVYVLFHKIFLDMNHNQPGQLPKQKGQCRVKKSKTTLVMEIWLPWIKEFVRNG